MRLAFFISPHGFGHAARATAVMEALHTQDPSIRFDLFTTVPEWFFRHSLDGLFRYHPCVTDVGLLQTSPFEFDIEATRDAVQAFIAQAPKDADSLATQVHGLGCSAVVCDISPLGLMVAERAGLPSILVENFTWDWLYEPLTVQEPAFVPIVEWMRARFAEAGQRIQARPRCEPLAASDLVVPPISRRPRRERPAVRAELGVNGKAPLIVVTMGGVNQMGRVSRPLPFLAELRKRDDVTFVVTGSRRTSREGNLWLFHDPAQLFMPDFIRAADGVVAKLGYGTLAEVWAAGRPLGYVGRSDFRETGPLEDFARSEIASLEISEADFSTGSWIDRIDDLLALGSTPEKVANGSGAAARWIMEATARV